MPIKEPFIDQEQHESESLYSRALEATRIKSALLTQGVAIDDSVSSSDEKPQIIGLYMHSDQHTLFAPPQEIIIDDLRQVLPEADGPFISNVRINQQSSWKLTRNGEALSLEHIGKNHRVALPQKPPFYDAELSGGIQASRVAQKLGIDAIGVVPNNSCSYFGSGMECRFCEIVPNYAVARTNAKAKKSIDQMAEAITLAAAKDPSMRYLFLTTGNDTSYDESYDRYVELLQKIHPLMKEKGITTFGVLMPPDNFSQVDRVHEAGLDAISFNLEVWDVNLFNTMTPGKASYGRDRMLAALDYGVDIFGKGNVLTNLIYGIQSYEFGNPRWKFNPKREEDILLDGIDKLLHRGILPTHTVYHTAGVNAIGPITLGGEEMLDYHLKYARLAYDSGVVPVDRFGLFGGLGTVSNSLFNDAYATVSLANRGQ